jgi:hypothetical protein
MNDAGLLNIDDAVAAIDAQESVELDAPPHPIEQVSIAKASKNTLMLSDDVLIEDAITFLQWHAIHTTLCPHLSGKKGKTNKCSCMLHFKIDDTGGEGTPSAFTLATARFIVFFSKQPCTTQQQYVMFWYRSAARYWSKHTEKNKTFVPYMYEVPVLCDPINGIELQSEVPYVCMSAMLLISRRKLHFWRTCMKCVQQNTIPEHGLIGQSSNNTKFSTETLSDLHAFLLK